MSKASKNNKKKNKHDNAHGDFVDMNTNSSTKKTAQHK